MSSHIGDANKKSHATVGGIAIDAEFAEPGMGIAEFRPFAERQLIASTSAAPGIDRRVRELLARRLRQWRTHLPADPAKPGTRAIRTYDHPGLEGETDYNNDVAIWREACSVLDEALTLIDASPKGGESMHNWSLRMAKLEEGQHIGAGAHGLQDSPKGGSDAQMVPYQRALDLIGDAYNAGTHGIGYSQQTMELHDAMQATNSEAGVSDA